MTTPADQSFEEKPAPKPNIKDVAREAGVSIATVSHVINETRYVAQETAEKVKAAMKTLNYSPNFIARSLRSHQSRIIGLIIPVKRADTSNFFFMSVAHGIESALKKRGYHLILSNSYESPENEKEQIRVFNSQLVDGLIIAPTNTEHEQLEQEFSGSYPVVFIDRKPHRSQGDCVLVDNFKGTYEAVQHLILKGHRRIGYITGPLGLTTTDERFEGYKQALVDNELSVEDSLIKIGDSTLENGQKLTGQLWQEQVMTALFVANNVMTLGAIKCLNDCQVDIPSDLAVIGFDDYEWSQVTSPPLSVIKQPAFEVGEKAAEVLLQRIHDAHSTPCEHRLPTEFIARDSS